MAFLHFGRPMEKPRFSPIGNRRLVRRQVRSVIRKAKTQGIMQVPLESFRWRVIACSEQGASHVRNGLPNQDAAHSVTRPDGVPPIVLTVADGHGSTKSFRSDVGARFAVSVAASACSRFLDGVGDASPSIVKSLAEQQLPRQIIAEWKQKVTDHLHENPLSQAESETLPPERYLTAYGATLLIAAITDRFHLYFQLGDGEILTVSDTGEVTRPIPKDESLIANETTSLCMENPLPAFRFRFQYFPDVPPAIVLLSTDGYPNSFRSDADFFKVGSDLLGILGSDGCDVVERDLPNWLREASLAGSGDDVTLGIIYRLAPTLGQGEGASIKEVEPPLENPTPSSGCLGSIFMCPVSFLGTVFMAPSSLFKRREPLASTSGSTEPTEPTSQEQTLHE